MDEVLPLSRVLEHPVYVRLVAAIRDEKRATRIAHDCHDPAHDVRWCGACDARSDGIDAYREALERVIKETQ